LRSRRAGLKRVGLLALALVIALGALGVAYSAWSDDLYIEGTVYTGTLDVDISGVSSTFAYKDSSGVIHMEYVYGGTPPTTPAGWTLVASAVTVDTSTVQDDVDSAEMTFTGVFPGYDFVTDMELEYHGTVPAKISLATVLDPDQPQDPTIVALWQMGENSNHTQGIWIDAWLSDDGGATWPENSVDPLGLQLHRDDLVRINMHVLLPEDAAYKNLSLNFSGRVTVIQFNEYEEP
jgi:hypothetical protein